MKSKIVLGAALLAATTLVGCGNDETTTDQNLTTFRAAHAASGAGNVDVYVDGNLLASNIPYTTISQTVNPVAGDHQVTITPAGNPGQLLLDSVVTLGTAFSYTGLALNGGVNIITGVLVAHNTLVSPNPGNLFGQFVNGAQATGNVDIYVYPAGTTQPSVPTVSNLPFGTQFPGDVSIQNPPELFGGNNSIVITQAGNPGNVLYSRSSANLAANERYVFVVEPRSQGTAAQGNLEVLVLPSTGNNGFIIAGDDLVVP